VCFSARIEAGQHEANDRCRRYREQRTEFSFTLCASSSSTAESKTALTE
jgi:hypothetical protein